MRCSPPRMGSICQFPRVTLADESLALGTGAAGANREASDSTGSYSLGVWLTCGESARRAARRDYATLLRCSTLRTCRAGGTAQQTTYTASGSPAAPLSVPRTLRPLPGFRRPQTHILVELTLFDNNPYSAHPGMLIAFGAELMTLGSRPPIAPQKRLASPRAASGASCPIRMRRA